MTLIGGTSGFFAWSITANGWVVRTADGDQYDEAFGEKMVPLDNSGRCPDGVVQVVSLSRGLTRDEMRECVTGGRAPKQNGSEPPSD